MKTLLAAAVSAVLLASGTVAFAETTANAPKIEQKAQAGATMDNKSKAPVTSVKADTKVKVDEKGKIADHAKTDAKVKVDAKSKIEAPVKK